MKRDLRKIHRWLGLIFSLSVLMSAGSGVLHNIMTRTQTPPPPARPSGGGLDVSKVSISLLDAMARIKEKLDKNSEVTAINVRQIAGNIWYQIFVKNVNTPYYINAVSGVDDPAQDEIYAQQIAMEYLGGASVSKTSYLTTFNSEYINIFRILPVYRFDSNDEKGTRVYVSTVTGSVTRHTDNERQFEANIFSYFHKLMFISNKDVRDFILTTMTIGIVSVSLLGILLFFKSRTKKS
jgi:hypothetical protein